MHFFNIALSLLFFFSLAFSNDRDRFEIIETLNNRVTVSFVNEEIVTEVKGDYLHITSSNKSTIEPGLPTLPIYTLAYGVNPDREYRVSYNIKESHSIVDVDIYPYQDEREHSHTQDIYINRDYFKSNGVYPENVAQETRAKMRGNEFLLIDIVPFSYNPVSKSLMVYDEVEIVIEETSVRENSSQIQKGSKVFQNIYDNLVLGTFDDREIDFQNPSILYICGGSSLNYTYMEYLLDWKRKQGYEVTAVNLTEIGGNSTTYIKNYIEDAYYNWENPPEFICLVGDASGSGSVPTVPAYSVGQGNGWSGAYAESDLPYVLLEGDDFVADATIGRISIRSETEFSIVANKIIGYEKLYAGSDWIESVALVGDPYDSGISTVISNEYIAQIMENYGVEDINEQYSGSNTFDDFMRDQINAGISYLNYRGFYGFSNFDESDINQLTNGFKLPFISTLTCDTGSYESQTSCDSEDLLRAGTINNPKGAVAVVATAQPYTHTAFNNIVTMGIFSGIFLYEAKTAGEALTYGELALNLAYPQNPNNNVYYFSAWNNLMGDPSLMLWTDTPRILVADHNEEVYKTDDFIDIYVIDENGDPVEGANVNLKPRVQDSYFNQTTDGSGHVYMSIDQFEDETIDVTVTCQDCYFSETSFYVSSTLLLPDLEDTSVIISDENDGNSNNGDGLVNPGELISVSFNLTNNTGADLSSFDISIQSSDENIFSATTTVEQLSSGESISVDALNLDIPSYILPDAEPLLFINISDGQSESNQLLSIDILSGSVSTHIDDNFSINPNETSSAQIKLLNTGEINFNQLGGEILYSGGDLSFSDTQLYWENANIGELSLSNDIDITSQGDIINGAVFNIPVRVYSDYSYEQVVDFSLVVGEVSVTDPLGPDAYGYYIYDELDIDYDLSPSYNWIEINPSQGGNGYNIGINDNGNNQDESETIDLPFEFTFYGISYDEVTICSNGWISFGDTPMESFRNYPIPGTGGPSPMVAVFWDDLEDGDVYVYNDTENERFIIEWYNFDTYYDNSNEEFQIILYNTGHLTPTGDDEMLLQYRDFNNTSTGHYPVGNYNGAVVHGQYTSVGLEDHTGLVGLEYTFNNEYPTAAAQLSDNSALFISTRSSALFAQPMLELSQSEFEVSLDPDEMTVEYLDITNSGEPNSYLTYELTVSPFANPQAIVDSYGYGWSTSEVDDYIDFEWVDISEDNVTLEFESNDLSPGYFDIGFEFPFYGSSYSEILINPNGWAGFGEDNNEWDNQSIFDEDSPRNAIFGYWEDMNPVSADNEQGEGYVRYHSNVDRMVIWYDDVIHWTSNDLRYDFQIILYPTGEIKVNYREMQGVSNDGATIGIVNHDGTIGQQVGFGDSQIPDNLALLFKDSPDWLTLSQTEGTLPTDQTDTIALGIDMIGYESGDHLSYLSVSTDILADVIIPIIIHVNQLDYLMGDLNEDGSIDILDVVRLVSIILNDDGTSYEMMAADISQDGEVNIIDAVLLVQIILNR